MMVYTSNQNTGNHGMYSGLDRVELFGIESDVKPEKITSAFDSHSTDDIARNFEIGIFTAFENYPVDGNLTLVM